MPEHKLARTNEQRRVRHWEQCSMTGNGQYKTVLVVDDEPSIAKVVSFMLARGGYDALVATDGEQALALARDHHGPIDLLLTDVMMPGMSGVALAAAMTRVRSGLVIVYMSGYVTELIAEDALHPGANFISKPFTADGLLAFIGRVLDSPHASLE